jgi:thioester reductase-like protein
MKVVVAAGKAGYSIVYNDVFQNTTPRALAAFTAGDGIPEKQSHLLTSSPSPLSGVPETGPDGYDYADIHALLARNTLEAFRNGQQTPLSDVLLFGGTGYLGSHVLRELIACHDVHIWCFVRPGKDERQRVGERSSGMSGEQRLKDRLSYYFGSTLEPLFASKVTVVEGDATDADALLSFRAPAEGMTVINCAASVKHFAKGNEIERTNVGSVKNITAWCEKNKARLVHISTGSVTGSRMNNMPPAGYRFDEHRLFAGQELESNQYVHSKFMAERHIYEEILVHGLKAKIMRVGNLAPRAQDGEFQVNYTSNNYMKSLQAYQTLGFIPYDALVRQTEFSPIDALAKAILALATTPEDCVCFMPMNTHRPLMGDIIRELSAFGNPIQGVENETFAQALNEALASEDKSQTVSTLIAYKNNDNIQTIGLDGCNCDYTNRILERLGFSWPETGSAYIRQFIERLAGKGFFN